MATNLTSKIIIYTTVTEFNITKIQERQFIFADKMNFNRFITPWYIGMK